MLESDYVDNLVARAAYDVDETGYWRRMPIVLGVVMSAAGCLILWATVGSQLQPREIVIRALAGGGLFSILFSSFSQWSANLAVSRAYAGSGKFAAIPPPNQEFAYRLPCSRAKTPLLGIGGTLYLGRSGLLFVAHERNPEVHREQIAFPLSGLTTAGVVSDVPWFLRLMVPRPPTLLECQSGSTRARFIVPAPMATIPKLEHALEELRRAG